MPHNFKDTITPIIRGHVDLSQSHEDGQARLRGWVSTENTQIDRIDITLKGKPWISASPLHERPDVKTALEPLFGSCPHVSRCGFDVTAPLPAEVEANSNTIVGITPYSPHGLRLESLQTHLCVYQDTAEIAPQPPGHLQERVGGSKDFVDVGAQLVSLILTCVGKHKPIFDSGMILDWAAAAEE